MLRPPVLPNTKSSLQQSRALGKGVKTSNHSDVGFLSLMLDKKAIFFVDNFVKLGNQDCSIFFGVLTFLRRPRMYLL